MARGIIYVACLCALLAISTTSTAKTEPSNLRASLKSTMLTPSGIGNLRIGMTIRQARRATGATIKVFKGSRTCRNASVRRFGLTLLIAQGRIARIDVSDVLSLKSLGGIGIGDTESNVQTTFGSKVQTSPHTYVQGGKYLTIIYTSGIYKGRGIRFETDQSGTITRFYAGKRKELAYMEGCF